MKVNRNEVEEYLQNFFVLLLEEKDKQQALADYLKETYGYPDVLLSDVLGKRKTLSEVSDYELFILTDGFKNVKASRNSVDKYFTDVEVNEYKKRRFKKPKRIRFPLKFNMIEVGPDQWIGRTTAKEIVGLRNAQIIRYNENIQRTMRRGMKGKTEEYRIMENKGATKEIRESMLAETFIPNTLTLNIPDDGFSDFDYADGVLIIRKANSLDIIDGFHRMIALEQAVNTNPSFDYAMELRITNYSEEKGQRFVYQEDQKTKMSKIDSNSFNIDDEAVKVCRRLNEDGLCNLQGQITRNKGLISVGEMALILKKLHFAGLSKNAARIKGIELAKELREDFNSLTEYDGKWMTEKYDFFTLGIVLTAFRWFREREKSVDGKLIEEVLEKANENELVAKRLKHKVITGPAIEGIEGMLRG